MPIADVAESRYSSDTKIRDFTGSALPLEPQQTDLANRNSPPEGGGSSIRWSPARRELLRWFHTHAQPLAEAYEGAIRLLGEPGFPGRLHFIAHAVRDIANRLADVLDPQSKGCRIEYHQELDRIEKLWPGVAILKEAGNLAVTQDVMTIKYELATMIDSLVEAHRKQRQEPSNSERLFRFLMRNESTRADVNLRLVSDFESMRMWFMSKAHLRDSKAPKVDEEELLSHFAKFEGMFPIGSGHLRNAVYSSIRRKQRR